jgi:hypothetical protein
MRISSIFGVAVIAMLALGISASQAIAAVEFRANLYPAKVTATQKGNMKFKAGGATVECKKGTYTSAEPELITGPSTTLLFTATFGECTSMGVAAEVSINGCLYLLMTNTATEGTLDIKGHGATKSCAEKPITIKVPLVGCEVTVGEQAGLKTSTYANSGALGVAAAFKIKTLAYHSNEKGLGCPKNGEEGAYEGELEAKGSNAKGEVVGISVGEGAPKWSASELEVWLINGNELKAGEKVATKATDFKFFIEVENTTLVILCEAAASVELIGGKPGRDSSTMTYTNCKVEKPTGCTMRGEATGKAEFELKSGSKLVTEAGKVYDVFGENERDEIVIEGGSCALAGILSFVGTFYGEVVGEHIKFVKEVGTLQMLRKVGEKEFLYKAAVNDESKMELKM